MKLRKIQDDFRGKAYSLTDKDLGCEELVIFFTRQGFARGGCVHDKTDEKFVVISGDIKRVGVKNGLIPKKTPHYFISKTDSVVMEWGPSVSEKQKKYKPYRDIVDKTNESNRT